MSTRDTIVLIVSVLASVWIFGGVSGFTVKFLAKTKMSPEYDLGSILNWPATWNSLWAIAVFGVVTVAVVAFGLSVPLVAPLFGLLAGLSWKLAAQKAKNG